MSLNSKISVKSIVIYSVLFLFSNVYLQMQDQYRKLVDFISFLVYSCLKIIIVFFVVSALTKDIVKY